MEIFDFRSPGRNLDEDVENTEAIFALDPLPDTPERPTCLENRQVIRPRPPPQLPQDDEGNSERVAPSEATPVPPRV